jgi:spermidine dehydrogenase
MKSTDRNLGMDRRISRRDLLHGASMLATSTLVPGHALAEKALALDGNDKLNRVYPPARTGLRGNHAGAFEVGHALGLAGRRDWGAIHDPDSDIYDLIIVGAGISGLTAAHFYRKQKPTARILILDNHDDFGGHAKRNEFQVGGRTLIGYGGSQTLEGPSEYSSRVKDLLRDLGVDTKTFDTAYDQNFFKRNGLGAGTYFNREDWGVDRVIRSDMGILSSYIPFARSPITAEETVAQIPITEPAKLELLRLLVTDQDQMPEIDGDAKWAYLDTISYREFLHRHLDIREPEVFAVLQDLAIDTGVGIEATTAESALDYGAMPGWLAAGLPEREPEDPYIHHFPDGNASIARLLVRELIPAVATGETMEDVVTARFDYSKLDNANSPVRLRLNSSVVGVEHDGDLKSATRVRVTYVRDGRAFRVSASACVLACNNAMIPHLCPEMPEPQREALALQVKTPILYTTVALRNWQAWKKIGIGGMIAPGSYHINAMLDYPVSLGGYSFAREPDEPITVHMERFPHRSNEGLTAREQHRAGQYELLSTPFETIERNIRSQLAGMLNEGGFDPAQDIEAITVNRWAHGYAYWYNPLFDQIYDDYNDERYPHMRARKPFGRITIANSDAGARANIESAIEQGYRAVAELI